MLLRTFVLSAALGLSLLPAAAAWADEKIVSDVTIEYPQQPDEPHRVTAHLKYTVCYQDTKARVEADDGSLVLYDLKSGMAYWVHANRKTFSVQAVGQFPDNASTSDWSHKLLDQPVPQSTVQLKAAPERKSIGGVDAARLIISGDVQLADASQSQGGYHLDSFPGGGIGGGGQAGGGFGSGPNLGQGPTYGGGLGTVPLGAGSTPDNADDSDDHTSTLHVDGELWVANLPVAPAPLLAQSIPAAHVSLPLLLPLCSKLPAQSVPVEGHLTMKTHFTPHAVDNGKLPAVMVVTVQLKSIETTPLPHSLFYPPAGYTEENAGSGLIH